MRELPDGVIFARKGRMFGEPKPEIIFNRRDRLAFMSSVERYTRSLRTRGRPGGPLSGNDMAVLKSLLMHQNTETGLCMPGVQRIADTAGGGLSKSTVYRSLSRLESHGIISRVRRLKIQVERIRIGNQATTRRRAVPDSNAYLFRRAWVKNHVKEAGQEGSRPLAYQASPSKCQGGIGTRTLDLYLDGRASGSGTKGWFTPEERVDSRALETIAAQMAAKFNAKWIAGRTHG